MERVDNITRMHHVQGFRSPNIPSTAEIKQIINGKLFENIKSSSILLVNYVQPDIT